MGQNMNKITTAEIFGFAKNKNYKIYKDFLMKKQMLL